MKKRKLKKFETIEELKTYLEDIRFGFGDEEHIIYKNLRCFASFGSLRCDPCTDEEYETWLLLEDDREMRYEYNIRLS